MTGGVVSECMTYAGFRRSKGDYLRDVVNFDCIHLIVPVEDILLANIRGLKGSPEDTVPLKDVKMKLGVCSMPVCWYGSEFPIVEQQPGKEIGKVGAVRWRGSKNSPGNRRGSPRTSSADDVFKSSFQTLGIPTKNQL